MTDLERADALLYALLTEDDAPKQEAMLARALAAARREGAEGEFDRGAASGKISGAAEMRERAARQAENLWFDARDTEWDEGVNCAKRRVAHAIRALPLTPEEL